VLVVEDEGAVLQLVCRILDGLGYTVLAAGSAGEAMALAEGHTGEMHWVIMSDPPQFFTLQTQKSFVNYASFLMVGVAQLVEHLVVAQVAVGSSPITHPI
jgi:CheY-like chemotaxis protein